MNVLIFKDLKITKEGKINVFLLAQFATLFLEILIGIKLILRFLTQYGHQQHILEIFFM